MRYLMADSKEKNDFDAKKWSTENGNLAEKAYEKWKQENLSSEEKTPISDSKGSK